MKVNFLDYDSYPSIFYEISAKIFGWYLLQSRNLNFLIWMFISQFLVGIWSGNYQSFYIYMLFCLLLFHVPLLHLQLTYIQWPLNDKALQTENQTILQSYMWIIANIPRTIVEKHRNEIKFLSETRQRRRKNYRKIKIIKLKDRWPWVNCKLEI